MRGCGGMRGGGGHAWQLGEGMCGSLGGMRVIQRDTVNEWAVHILLECILVHACYHILFSFTHFLCITQLRVKVFNGVFPKLRVNKLAKLARTFNH